ncbi:DUF1786 domain-containing protein [Desulfovibrio sp. OttesenSCG-928-I05]|nr:DUF1786 domain-containing protein [Desulfovibrio sp. OttesenSCG-928-I05]
MSTTALSASAPDSVLCIDIGSRTQDALLFTRGETPANIPRMVLPSPPLLLARRIAALTDAGLGVYLHGTLMGDGFIPALSRHLDAGRIAAMHPATADAFAANGVALPAALAREESCPENCSPLRTGDVDLSFWKTLCRHTGLELPLLVAVAARDLGGASGETPGNMSVWRDTLFRAGKDGVPAETLMHSAAPAGLARLAAIQSVTGGPVADSGAAALLGLLSVRAIAERSHREGLLLINAGNSHITAFLVYRERVFGVYEHLTFGIDREQRIKDFTDFRLGWLPGESVIATGGRGCLFVELPPEAEGFKAAYITGPQRDLLRGMGQMAAAFDDVAQTGCFGLLHGMGYI